MAHGQKRLALGFNDLCQAVNVSALPFLNMSDAECQKEVVQILEKVSQLPDEKWTSLPLDAQKLFDAAAERSNAGRDPSSLCIEIVANGADTSSKDSSHLPTREITEAPVGAATTATSTVTGETKTVTSASTGNTKTPGQRGGGGNRKNPATDWCRRYVVDHPDMHANDVMKACLEQNFPLPISKGTVDTVVFEMRNCLRILRETGKLK